MNLNETLIQAIAQALQSLYGWEGNHSQITLQKTRSEFEGDLTLVVFPFLKSSKKSPEATAQELGEYLLKAIPETLSAFQVIKGFLNLSISMQIWKDILKEMLETPQFGHKALSVDSPNVMVEYSSPNTNKPLHLGHVRNNLLGHSISQILRAYGMNVIRTNIVNDRGIHICKSMLAWKKWGEGTTPETSGKKGDHLVGDFYVLFDKKYKEEVKQLVEQGLSQEEAEKQSPLMQEAREMLVAWENGDPEVISLWKTMNQWVYDGFDTTYQRMGVGFDKIYYESETYLEGKKEVLRGLDENLFVKHNDGSVWADLTQEGLDEKLLLRSDGTSVYMTQDIGTAKKRYGDYSIDKMVYVVGNEQEYHFKVLSILLDRLGFSFGKSLVHFSYGMVELPNGKMKSREGTVVDADDLMDAMIQTAQEIAQEAQKNKGTILPEEETLEIARKVGLGALKYFILKVDPRKNMTFNPEESIDFNGNTGPFIQYTYSRICSLKDKAGFSRAIALSDSCALPSSREAQLIAQLAEYPSIVGEAAQTFSPAIIANYVYELVKEYNSFYHDFSVLKEEDLSVRNLRLLLSDMVSQVIEQGMTLLGIEMPRRM